VPVKPDPNYSTVARFGLLLIAAMILASCTTNRTDTPAAEAAPQPLTQSKAAEQCWMETEQGNKSLPLDKRAKVVDKCVKDKMIAARATSADSK
jgi:ABC-type enterochelin transport system substrate-binding protein